MFEEFRKYYVELLRNGLQQRPVVMPDIEDKPIKQRKPVKICPATRISDVIQK